MEFFKQARDSRRLDELQSINTALAMFQIDQSGTSMGSANTFYVSIPSSQTNCSDLGLPSLPDNWSYACSNSTNYRKVDSTGWIPVNFTSLSYRTPLEILPIDPINTTSTGNYYTYITGGSWELNAMFESSKYRFSGEKDKTSKDGGDFWAVYELGTNLTLSPLNGSGSVGYWKFDGGTSGSIANNTTAGFEDSSGNGNNGTASNANGAGMAWTTGKLSGAVNFDGVDDYVDVASSTSLNITDAITIEAWVYPKGWNPGGNLIVSKCFYYAGAAYNLWINEGHTSIKFYINEGQFGSALSFDGALNKWYHIVGTYDRQYVRVYVNGVGGTPYANTSSINTNTYNVAIGSRPGGGSYNFNGLIDEVRIYNRALSPTEISAIYNATK